MKKFLLLFMAVTVFSSCSSDDSQALRSEPINENLLIGAWQFDADPGYGDPTFFENGRVEVKYFDADTGDDFSEMGDWTLEGNNLKIMWDESDPGSEVYDTQILELSETKLRWEVEIDGELSEETFTKL